MAQIRGESGDSSASVAVDGDGSVVIGGQTYSTFAVGRFDGTLMIDGTPTASADTDGFVRKLSPAGAELWTPTPA